VGAGYCLANRGKEYVVFQNKAQGFALKLEGLSGPARANWFNPFTGDYQDAGTLANGTVPLTPPPAWGSGPVALHVSVGSVASSSEGLRRSELSQGWKIKSIPPQATLEPIRITFEFVYPLGAWVPQKGVTDESERIVSDL
ncbi:MAG: hypothetical protein EHM21_16485, partial [Chloroflexi bacterium]